MQGKKPPYPVHSISSGLGIVSDLVAKDFLVRLVDVESVGGSRVDLQHYLVRARVFEFHPLATKREGPIVSIPDEDQ